MADTPLDRIRSLWARLPEEDRRTLLKELASDPDGQAARRRIARDGLWKRGDIWWIRYTLNGVRYSESAKTRSKDVARALLEQRKLDAERGMLNLPKVARQTLSDFEPKYLEWARRHKSSVRRDEWCLRQLLPLFGHFRLADITRTRIEAYQRDRLKEGIKGSTINRAVALLRKVLAYAVECGELSVNPLKGVRMLPESPARQPSLDAKDESSLLQKAAPWLRPVLRLALATGCRQGELIALRWRHVDFDSSALIIESSKSGESRRVPLRTDILAELASRRGTADGFVLLNEKGKGPISATQTSHAFKSAAKAIGRPELRFHDLRHVAGTRLLSQGANLQEIAAILGHKTLSMARRYSHPTWTRLQGLMEGVAETAKARKSTKEGSRDVS